MSDSVLLVCAISLNFLGMRWLALSLPVHWKQVYGEQLLSQRKQVVFRILAAVMFIFSLVLIMFADHATIAALVWIMSLTACAFSVAMMLSRKANRLRFI